jgi:UDP-N-acetylmuramyl pentapeptide synthase
MGALARLPARLSTVLGRRSLVGALVPRLAPVIYAGVRLRRVCARPEPVVAIVGSFGKTTTTRAIRAVLGLPTDVQPANLVVFAGWHLLTHGRRGRPAVIEAGIERPGQMAPAAAALRPDIVVVTAVGHEHLTSFHTLEAIRAEKGQMVRAMRPDGTVFLNGDDPHVLWMRSLAPGRVVTFGFGEACDVRAGTPRLDWPHGTVVDVTYGGTTSTIRLRLIGRHFVYPALAALAVGASCGVDRARAIERLAQLPSAAGRLQPLTLRSGAVVLCDDVKSSWETMIAALDLLAEIPARRRIVLVGDITEPPPPHRSHYRQLGARVASIADRLIVVGDQFRAYRTGAREAGMPEVAMVDAGPSILRAIDALPADLGPGDVVLLKGRLIQRFERITLHLAGRPVGCRLVSCRAVMTSCGRCPMLERGWPDGRERYP